MALENTKTDLIRHGGEAVGIGILCEIFYTEGKSKNFELVKNLLNIYNLPTNLLNLNIRKNKTKIKKNFSEHFFR